MTDCNRARLEAYHDGDLNAADRVSVEAHLRDCPRCAAELKVMRGMTDFFSASAAPAIPEEELLRLAEQLRAKPGRVSLVGFLRAAAVAAAVVLACTVAAGSFMGSGTDGAAREALVLDGAVAQHQTPDANSAAASEQHLRLAQWIVNDLATGRQEIR